MMIRLTILSDFCLWAPPSISTISDTEREEVAWCTKSGLGTRTIPNGTLQSICFVKTLDYVQISGFGNLTKINFPENDTATLLDPHGADGKGNPSKPPSTTISLFSFFRSLFSYF